MQSVMTFRHRAPEMDKINIVCTQLRLSIIEYYIIEELLRQAQLCHREVKP